MNTVIFRKPKCMRDDLTMTAYMDTIDILSNRLSNPDLSLGQRYEILREIDRCIDMAAEAGGFLNTNDFIKWVNKQQTEKTES